MSEAQEFATLRCERDGAVATITLDRPKALNALNAAMFDDLERVFQQLAGDASIRVILVTGSGERAFAAGADIAELVNTDSISGRAVSERGQQVFSQIESCGKPVIACVNGFAFGGGCELALACTLRIASEKAVFGLPEVKLGLVPGYGGTQRMARLIGRGQALRLMLTAQSADAMGALRLGLVEEVVPVEELMPRAEAIAQTIAGMAPLAIAGILEAVERGGSKPLTDGLRDETEIFARLSGTSDKHEGLTAFLEKRAAVWQGK
ncbi:MAG TPA: enoyl-CoA hydratase-related protein [Acidobacteriaceae bacterium]|jgi:enoyl-CoA hydratase